VAVGSVNWFHCPVLVVVIVVGPSGPCGVLAIWTALREERRGGRVQWASDALAPDGGDVGVDHGRVEVAMTEKLLNCPDVITSLKHVGGK
jgi:hypothetical protein